MKKRDVEAMINSKEFYAKKKWSPIERNKRMTAIAGTVLFVLIIVELVITAKLHELISEHIFVGILLSGPLVVKIFSTGYRFFLYYTKSPDFVRAGPPNTLLRLLAPFLVLITILVFISGFGLVLGGHAKKGLFLKIHAVSITLWLPLLAVHIYAYIRKVPGLIANDWTRKSKFRVPGREGRVGINVAALIVSGIAAIIMTPWNAGGHGHGIPSPLVLGIVAAVIAVLIAIPLLRITNKTTKL
ncbi:hypothetical protein NDK43_26980 [Neobacillus pocheonensis]|uniref:DUF4405 domain-containing protein n=1 Tax=Neobacillus pocheonensis TaxID=363869 RepID=A0ABT0WG85_9BACI|nr:hypothetical protein [Neobacillus pocheonensis]